MRNHLTLLVNGQKQTISSENSNLPIADFLRREMTLTGTKIVCAEGDCGACSVLLGRPKNNTMEYLPVNSCIVPMYLADGCHLVTVEGLQKNRQMNTVQESMLKNHGAQCGYCTPGFVVTLTGLMEDGKQKSREEIRQGLCGNLCRCTGYEPIINAGLQASEKKSPSMHDIYDSNKVFQELQQMNSPFKVSSNSFEIFAPDTLKEALAYKAAHADAKIIQGATDLGVMINKRGLTLPKALVLSKIPALSLIEVTEEKARIGTCATLTEFETKISTKIPEIFAMMKQFASPQIKNVGSLVGNALNASPIADSIPFLLVLDAQLHLQSHSGGSRVVPINSFYQGYKKFDLRKDELVTHLEFEIPKNHQLKLYRNSRRSHLDIANVTAAFLFETSDKQTIEDIKIAYGGVGPIVYRLPKTEKYLINKTLDSTTIQTACNLIESEITPMSDVRASKEYRHLIAKSFMKKLALELSPGDIT